jgi:DNA-binding MarR family transcriptional regulator
MGSEQLELDRQLCFALYSSSLAMTRLYKPLLRPLGLTYPQYLVLMVLWAVEEATVSTLGEKLFLDSGTLTPLLKRLETSALVSRSRDPKDERCVQIRLTAKGRALQTQALGIPLTLARAAACEPEHISQLTQRLQALRGQLRQAQP